MAKGKGIIIGGGIIGLTIARGLYKRGYDLTIVDKDVIGKGASWTAGGMLAPQSEGLDIDDFFKFCLESRDMYKDFTEEIVEETGKKVNYWKCGILCPAFDEMEMEYLINKMNEYKSVGKNNIEFKNFNLNGEWIDRSELENIYTSLGKDILGGVLYYEDGQVDNQLLLEALKSYVIREKIDIREKTKVLGIIEENGKFEAVKTENGKIEGDFCILSAGAWTGEIIDIPIFPIKGEMISMEIDIGEIDRVIFSSKAYIIPRLDYSKLVIGATEERVGFKDGNTVKGVMKLMKGLTDTFPHMEHKDIKEFWFGYRPGSLDLLPVIGEYKIENLFLATGHYRNGILLAPITEKIISELIDEGKKSPYLELFSWKRFF